MQSWLETASGMRIVLHSVCSIGRSSKNTLALDNPEVSRRHALIHAQGDGHWLIDLGSSNGVLLNGRRVRQPVKLLDQDRVEIVGSTFVFREKQRPAEKQDSVETTLATMKGSTSAALWLLVADIEGATQLSQKVPTNELAQIIGKWFLNSKEIIESSEGVINKYLGDGYLSYWPKVHTAPSIIAKTLTGLGRLQEAGMPPFRVVVHFGNILVDRSLSEGEDSLVGSEVNFVFRMEKVAGGLQEQRLISEAAATQLEPLGLITPLGSHKVPSFEGRHSFYSYDISRDA